MPCGGSSQVFAFTTLSPTSQLSLASCMTTSALLEFANDSPAFGIFLHSHCEEIVLTALRTQYGYIPDTADWDTYNLLPLYTDHSSTHTNNIPRTIPRVPTRRHHKRSSRTPHDLLLELPLLQRLIDEELLSDHGQKLFSLLPNSPQASSVYGPGIRGLLRYCQHYTTLAHEGRNRVDMHEIMQHWLQERYTHWGITEMEFVVDALSSRIDSLLPSLLGDAVKREQLLGSLLCGMEVLRLETNDDNSEEAMLQKLADRGIIEFLPSTNGQRWKVTDTSHSHWFSTPAHNALEGKYIFPTHKHLHKSSSESVSSNGTNEREYVLGHEYVGNKWGEGLGGDQASFCFPADAEASISIKLIVMARAAARGTRTEGAKTIGV